MKNSEYWQQLDIPFGTDAGTSRPLSADNPLHTQVDGDHYKFMPIQPVAFIHANNIPFIEGCCIKYLCRWRDKGGLKDLEKVKHFVDLLVELERSKL